MKILVTGATGFIGSHVVRYLLSQNLEVVATSRNESKAREMDWFDKVEYIPYSIESSNSEKNKFLFFSKPDILIHLAWPGLPDYKSLLHCESYLFHNYFFIKNMVENGLKHVLVTGTCFEYGMQDGSLDESMLTIPTTPYAIAKDSLRKFLEVLALQNSFNMQWVRLFYMYGEGQNPRSIVPLLENAILGKKEFFNMSQGEQLRDYLEVTLVAEYISKIALQDKINGIINCCNGKPISIRELIERHLDKLDKKIKLNLGYYPYPDYEPMAFWGNNNKLKSIIE